MRVEKRHTFQRTVTPHVLDASSQAFYIKPGACVEMLAPNVNLEDCVIQRYPSQTECGCKLHQASFDLSLNPIQFSREAVFKGGLCMPVCSHPSTALSN